MGGGKKESGTTVVNQTTTPTPTAEETALNQRNLRIALATEGGEQQAQLASLNLINQLLAGNVPSGPLYSQLTGGVSPTAIANQATSMMRAGRTGAQASGIAESGSADRAIANELAGNLLFPAEQFNIGATQNLLNLALSGQAQVQQPIQANVGQLGSALAGLRSINTQGTTSYNMNTRNQMGFNDIMGGVGSAVGGVGGLFKGLGSVGFKF